MKRKDNPITTTTTTAPVATAADINPAGNPADEFFKSIFNPEFTVTREQSVISYCKAVATDRDRSIDPKYAQHTFIVIQTHNELYRGELALDKPKTAYAIRYRNECFINARSLTKATQRILGDNWDKERSHKTWLVDTKKAFELIESITREIGPFNNYHMGGDKSLLEVTKVRDSLLICAAGAIRIPLSFPLPSFSEFSKADYMLTGWYLFGLLTSFTGYKILEAYIEPEVIREVHNCGTWAEEKLRDLNVPEITQGLETGLFVKFMDRIAYMGSLHLSTTGQNCIEATSRAPGVCVKAAADCMKTSASYVKALTEKQKEGDLAAGVDFTI
jgi:hypothetical protein